MVLEVFWTCLGGLSGRFLTSFWDLESEIRSQLDFETFEAVFDCSWSRLGGVLEASWSVLEASWRPLRASWASLFASWKPSAIRDLFPNELKPSWRSFLNDFQSTN